MIEIPLVHYLFLSAIIFTLGVFGIFVNRKNVIVLLMSIELILLSVNVNLVAFSVYLQNITGQIFALFIFCLLYTSPSPRDRQKSRMPSSA